MEFMEGWTISLAFRRLEGLRNGDELKATTRVSSGNTGWLTTNAIAVLFTGLMMRIRK